MRTVRLEIRKPEHVTYLDFLESVSLQTVCRDARRIPVQASEKRDMSGKGPIPIMLSFRLTSQSACRRSALHLDAKGSRYHATQKMTDKADGTGE